MRPLRELPRRLPGWSRSLRRRIGAPQPLNIEPPPGLDPATVRPLDPVPPEAITTLAALLPQLTSDLPVTPVVAPQTAPTSEDSERALRLYARARAAANANQMPEAVSFLDEAVKADPTHASIWRLRGDVLAATGQRLGSLAAYQRTLDLGRIEPRACLLLGIAAADQGDHLKAARYLAGAIQNHNDGEDPALPVIANAALGVSLHQIGRLVAGNEAIERAVGSPLQFTATTSYRPDLQTLARRRSDLAREAGDAWARLGDSDRALEAYEQAATNPSFDPSSITERRVYVLSRAGRPAEAALVLLDDVVGSSLRVDDRQLSLFRYLSSGTDLGPLIAQALAELPGWAEARAAALGVPAPRITPTVQGRLARAGAAIDPTRASDLLAAHIAKFPDNADAAREWVALAAPEAVRQSAAEIVERQPLAVLALGDELARSLLWPAIVAQGSEVQAAPATLSAAVLLAQGEYAEASRALRAAPAWNREAGVAAAALVASGVGDVEHAERLLVDVRDPRLRGRILLALQRPAEAKAQIELVSGPPADSMQLDMSAEIALGLRDGTGAESLLRRAIEADPFDESLYERLAGLYRTGAPLANQDKLFGVYRDLRVAVPSSRLLRALNAQDAAQRGSLAQAETELASLLEQDPDDALAAQLLIAVWQRRVRDDPTTWQRAEAMLSAQRQVSPASPTAAISLAHVVDQSGRGPEAETILRSQLDIAPAPSLHDSLEALLRDRLDREAEADQLALLRLSPAPRPIDVTIELARVRARTDDLDGAVRALEADLPGAAILTPAQGASIQLILADVGPAASANPNPTRAKAVLRLIDVAMARSINVTPGLHELRIALLASLPDQPADRIIGACADARAQNPSLGTRPFKRAIAALAESDRHTDALPVAIAGLEAATAPDSELSLMAVRLVVLVGEADDLRRVLDRIPDLATASAVLEPIHPDGALALDSDDTLDTARAEIAFMVGNYLAVSNDRKSSSDDVYRLAIRYSPSHAMAANNLGYTLLIEGRNPDEAERLLEAAYRIAPDDPNVVDSIGWLRYQFGRITDSPHPDGTTIEGAITLLQRALIIDVDGGSAVSMDHYADALWAGGEREDAILQWEQALAELEREMADLESAGRSDPDHPPLLESINAKLEAVRSGREPAIAPMRWAPEGRPMPTASNKPLTGAEDAAETGSPSPR
jgi:tetratricopeptide (TPR) repeat protein